MNPLSLTRRGGPVPAAALFLALALAAHVAPRGVCAEVSRNVTLLSNMNLYAPEYAACWSYVHADGREYAVILTSKGASFVRLTDPAHPVEVGFINAPHKPWLEAKQYGDHVYLSTEYTRDYVNPENDDALTIVRMSDPDHPMKVASFKSPVNNAHTLTIDEARGLLYLNGVILDCPPPFIDCQTQMQIYSLADPENPALIGTYPEYVHDIHVKGNLGYVSLIFNDVTGSDGTREGTIAILDLSDPTHPVEISRFHTPRTLQHSSWTSVDGRFLYAANEWGRDALTVWDVQNPAAPSLVYKTDIPKNTCHQPHVRGNTLFVAWYTAGVRLFDIRNPAWPVEFGYYDTFPGPDGEYHGAWECAPYYPSGIFVVSDIETGLWVFRQDPVSYGIVRGTVSALGNGPPLAGALVTAQPSGLTTRSGPDGRYALALPAGVATLGVSLFGFDAVSTGVSVGLDTDQTVNITLRESPAGAVQGVVRSLTGDQPLGAAELEIAGTPLRTTSDASGGYAFASVPEGSYSVRSVRPGFAPAIAPVSVTRNHTSTVGFSLRAAFFYDDVEADAGWVLGAPEDPVIEFDPTYGAWVRAEPAGSIDCDLGDQVQTEFDHTPEPGSYCFVTDNRTRPCFTTAYSVVTRRTLTSPVVHAAGIADPRVGYWRWYVNNRDDFRVENDAFVTQLSGNGGQSWITIDSTFTNKNEWEFVEIRLQDFIPTPGDVLVRFIVDNPGTGFNAVESAIDDFQAYAGGGGGSLAAAVGAPAPRVVIGAPTPSPSKGRSTVSLALGRPTPIRADVYDVSGRLVRTVERRTLPAGNHTIEWDGTVSTGPTASSGIYWLRVTAGEIEKTMRLVIVR